MPISCWSAMGLSRGRVNWSATSVLGPRRPSWAPRQVGRYWGAPDVLSTQSQGSRELIRTLSEPETHRLVANGSVQSSLHDTRSADPRPIRLCS
jgi:hypothetical protein